MRSLPLRRYKPLIVDLMNVVAVTGRAEIFEPCFVLHPHVLQQLVRKLQSFRETSAK